MLQALQIENYVLIRSLSIRFDQGFTVITGETGAGKSILLGALSLILGHRADADVLLDKQRKCIVEGTFDLSKMNLQSFFEQQDLDYQDTTIIRREINEKGKSRAFINDTPVTLSVLKELTGTLIDIHSQHQNLLLNNSSFRLHILDQYARNGELYNIYKETFNQWKKAEQQYQLLKQQCAESALQQEFNLFTIQELEKAALQPDEQERVEQAIQLLSHAEEIKAHLFRSAQQLSDGDGDTVIQQLKSVQHECQSLANLGDEYQELCRRIENAIVELQDISYEISRRESETEVNPQELERLNERIDLIYTLEKKYQLGTIPELLSLQSRLQTELDHHADHQAMLERADGDRSRLAAEVLVQAQRLSQSRQQAAPALEQTIGERLRQLSMPDSQFRLAFAQSDVPHAEGIDQVAYLFSANKGTAPADVSQIASGGEMSRLMLAVKSIITDSVLLPTVIFDEIDTGISGEAANRVAQVMAMLAERHQVIAITHLPQIAAKGRQHYLVHKATSGERTETSLRRLEPSEREQAIAAMLSGSNASAAAIATARELLSQTETQTTPKI